MLHILCLRESSEGSSSHEIIISESPESVMVRRGRPRKIKPIEVVVDEVLPPIEKPKKRKKKETVTINAESGEVESITVDEETEALARIRTELGMPIRQRRRAKMLENKSMALPYDNAPEFERVTDPDELKKYNKIFDRNKTIIDAELVDESEQVGNFELVKAGEASDPVVNHVVHTLEDGRTSLHSEVTVRTEGGVSSINTTANFGETRPQVQPSSFIKGLLRGLWKTVNGDYLVEWIEKGFGAK